MRSFLIGAVLALAATPGPAQFATTVLSYVPGNTSAGGLFNTTLILGGPQGLGLNAGSQDVLTLGAGGAVMLGFGTVITDGPGVDFTVFENGFYFPVGTFGVFAEVAYVEVSSNGIDFARFPSRYVGPPSVGAFSSVPAGTYAGLAGGMPCLANVMTGIGDPFDPVVSGGDSFDLADLVNDPLVASGSLDLTAVHFVRLVDVRAGVDQDSGGTLIQDSGGAGSADIDAVAVLNDVAGINPNRPSVDLFFDSFGFLHLTLADPDGIADLDAPTFQASFDLLTVTPAALIPLFVAVAITPNGVESRTIFPVQGQGALGVFAVSIRDQSGLRSADRIVIQ